MDYVFPTIILIALITIGLKLLRPKQEKILAKQEEILAKQEKMKTFLTDEKVDAKTKAIATFAIKSFANGFIGGLGFALAMYILFLLFANSINL